MLTVSKPVEARQLMQQAQRDVTDRWRLYEQMASIKYEGDSTGNA